ncbi:hypothetical protein EOPP23_14940 [Endozoicomonas sp. OPT23]|uniref:TniB family NTP-binding protein n=1 Tax=Endozoicomonas sp. OPT23 TaxID=2072845 RepID=UPI00129C0FDE|nr:TniB family NTP-binding protein [Endozoicomonas sp. OPT23]MRI34284.1 hypothetical protein [Endozoicomonas sp. OPT23]
MNKYYDDRDLWIEKAVYKEQPLSRNRGIPYIEALPLRMDMATFTDAIENPIPYDPAEKNLPAHERAGGPFVLSSWFLSQAPHYDLYLKFDSLIRDGYFQNTRRINRSYSLTPLGGFLIAPSGTGKSDGTANCLQLIPDIIIHDPDHFEDSRDFQQYQVPVLMIMAPHDGKEKSLEKNIIESLKYILQDRFGIFIDEKKDIRYLLRYYKVGLLAIDEVPFLLQSSEDNYETILNYLVYLRTRLCIPVLFIGTPDILKIFEKYPSQTRKIIGPGSTSLLPMFATGRNEHRDFILSPDFVDFIREMWEYQWIEQATDAPSEAILQAFYMCTAGIRDYIVKLFQLIQIKLIYDHNRSPSLEEVITPELINTVAEQELRIVNNKIQCLVENPASAQEIQDMGLDQLPEIAELARNYQIAPSEEQQTEYQHIRKKVTNEQSLTNKLLAEGIEPDRAHLLARCIINKYPDAKDQLRKALNLDADPEFGKLLAPYIERKEINITSFKVDRFRSCYTKDGGKEAVYENLKINNLTTNLRDL